MRRERTARKYYEKENLEKYFKVIWVNLRNNDCDLLKGPEDERKLMNILLNDYNCRKYDKWVTLIANEKVNKEDADYFKKVLSSADIKKEFQKKKGDVEYCYIYNVDGEERRVRTRISHRTGIRCFPGEIMIYVEI